MEAKDTIRKEVVQDEEDLVVTGADVEGLYPQLMRYRGCTDMF